MNTPDFETFYRSLTVHNGYSHIKKDDAFIVFDKLTTQLDYEISSVEDELKRDIDDLNEEISDLKETIAELNEADSLLDFEGDI